MPKGFWSQLEKLACMAQGKGAWMMTLEMEVQACLALLGKAPSTLCDVGANRGIYTDKVMQYAPDARYFLFEPAEFNIAILRQKYHNHPKVSLLPVALSNRAGEAVLHAEAPGAETASLALTAEHQQPASHEHKETIQTARLDTFWTQLTGPNQTMIDWVKIDVEGYEFAVLQGFGDKIRQTRLVQFEYGARNLDTRTNLRDFWDFFQAYGFSLYRITPHGPSQITAYSPWEESAVTTNLIAVNQALPA